MWNGIKLDDDVDLHKKGWKGCHRCVRDYPHVCDCGGLIHGDHRYNMEAGFRETIVITRRDQCGNESNLAGGLEKAEVSVSNDNRRRG